MKTSLLKRYFDGNYFMNQVICAAFRQREEWVFSDLVYLVALVSVYLKAPPMRGTEQQVKGWVQSGWALIEKRGDEYYLRPGKTHEGQDVRELGEIPPAVVATIAPCIEKMEKLRQYETTLGGAQ